MGALCCCFHVPDDQDNTTSTNSRSNDCLCPRCVFQKFMNKHRNLFTRQQIRTISSPNQRASSSNSEGVVNYSSYTSRSRVQPEPARQSDIQVKTKSVQGDQIVVSCSAVRSEQQNCKSAATSLSFRVERGIPDTLPSSDDEDVCPTCFEEYTQENPKITAKCSHHYHLGCIYEWMERSENCPACRKLMLFDEAS